MAFIFVGLGGAVGAMLRYAISLIPYKGEFPLLTLITNLLGALLIGYVVGVATKKGMSQNTLLFLKTGLCGGFTTFSTFSLEAYQLLQNHHYVYGASYMILSVGLCVVGVAIGMMIGE